MDGSKRFDGWAYDVEADIAEYKKILPDVLPLISDTVRTAACHATAKLQFLFSSTRQSPKLQDSHCPPCWHSSRPWCTLPPALLFLSSWAFHTLGIWGFRYARVLWGRSFSTRCRSSRPRRQAAYPAVWATPAPHFTSTATEQRRVSKPLGPAAPLLLAGGKLGEDTLCCPICQHKGPFRWLTSKTHMLSAWQCRDSRA